MIKTKSKHWHLSDFKETAKFMYIVFDDEFHDKFYNTAIKIAGGQRRLAKKLGFYSSRINNYLSKERRPSLETIEKISNFLVNNNHKEFNMDILEKYITKIKVNGQPISISPRFPIILDNNLVRIIANLIGDGGINKFFHPHYSNNDSILLNNLKHCIKKVFGCNDFREYSLGNKKQIWCPKTIGRMMVEIFGKFAFGRNPKYIPEDILNSDIELKAKFLNSLYGDEGSTGHYQIGLYQGKKNILLLKQVKDILKDLEIQSNEIIKVKDKHIMKDPYTGKEYIGEEIYAFSITGYKEIMKFKEKIGFPKNSKKNTNFLNMIKTKYPKKVKRNKVGETKKIILDLLARKDRNINELSNLTGFSKETIYNHINYLKSKDKISIDKKTIKLKGDKYG